MSQTSVIVSISDHKSAQIDQAKVDWLRDRYDEKLIICDKLEEIADSLPDSVSRAECLAVANALPPLMRRIHDFEENSLFPWLSTNYPARPELSKTLNRLKFEHVEDECFSEELLDLLHRMANGGKPNNPEAAGYMLRGFFEGMRRHVAFERDYLMQLVESAVQRQQA